MLTVACVLRSGGEYKREHVRHLRDGVKKHLAIEHRFVCLTDTPIADPEIHSILLIHDWPGWFSKLEIFRPGLFDGPTLYLDLDTLIVGPLDDIVLGHRFTVLRNFWVAKDSPRIGSGLMAWDVDATVLYSMFSRDPGWYMASSRTAEYLGDQGFIQRYWPWGFDTWQDRHPGRVVSYKHHVLKNGGKVPEGASIICYHGAPRPWNTDLWRA